MRYTTRPRTIPATAAAWFTVILVWMIAGPAAAQTLPNCTPTGSVEVFATIGPVNANTGLFTIAFDWVDEPGDDHRAIVVDASNVSTTVDEAGGSATLHASDGPFAWLGLNERPDGRDYCKGTGQMSPQFTPPTTTTTVPPVTTTTPPDTPPTTVPPIPPIVPDTTTSTTTPDTPTTTTDDGGTATSITTSSTIPPVTGGTLPFTGPEDYAGTIAGSVMAAVFGIWTIRKFRNAGRHAR